MSKDVPARPGYGPVLRHPVAGRLVAASAASSLGDFVGLGALLVVATERAGGLALGAAGLFAVQAIPGLLAGTVLSGRLAALRPRRSLVGASLLGASALALVLTVGGLWPVYVTAALLGTARAINSPMVSKEVAETVPSDLRTSLFALTNSTFQAGQVPGLLMGGVLAGAGFATFALWFDVATFLLAATMYLGLKGRDRIVEVEAEHRRSPLQGLDVILHHGVARSVIPAVWGTLLVGAIPEAVVPSVVDGGPVGIVLASGPAAAMVTGLVLGRGEALATPRRAFRLAWFVPLGVAAMAAAFLVPAGTPQIVALALSNAFLGVALAWLVGAQGSMARTIPPADLAQVNATMMASVMVLEGLGAIVVGGIADVLDPAAGFGWAAVVALIAIQIGWRQVPSDRDFDAAVDEVDRMATPA